MAYIKLSNPERSGILGAVKALGSVAGTILTSDDITSLKDILVDGERRELYNRDIFGLHPLQTALDTAVILCDKVSPDRTMVIAALLHTAVRDGVTDASSLKARWGDDIALAVERLLKVDSLYDRHPAAESENFSRLLLTFAQDIRVIILMIAARLALMRAINHHPLQQQVRRVAMEAGYLYAPLAHRLGLYAIKSELEDLSLKYTNRDIYTTIARKLNETKAKREAYIANFIEPVKKKIEAEGIKFDIKGRTKSIYSIWNKMKKQKNDLDHIYDLFAIRIIIDAPPAREKAECWLAYSLITDMFTPNPARMKDWISIPKANGYESLHITVYGPDQRWVEVQIRTRRMDDIAEKGLAAHWKYKGIKSEGNLDTMMANVRDILETAESGPMELMKNMRMDVYNKEVFVFTPKGDLHNLPQGASLLDFAFYIHTNLGARCTGGKVNGKVKKINYRLQSGDTVEIMTSQTQQPKKDWLNFAITSKARNKIRTALKEQESHYVELGRELLERRFKNRKLEADEAAVTKLVKKLGYKTTTEFYSALGNGTLEPGNVVAAYEKITATVQTTTVSADEYVFRQQDDNDNDSRPGEDVLVIGGGDIKGLSYKLAKCCHPIYGDDVFGFVSSEGTVKIHRRDCPNATDICRKYPYRLIKTKWSGKLGGQMGVTLRILGHDDLGIVTNITSLINKEKNATLRNISIDAHDGLFQGYVVIGISDTTALNNLIKKIKTIKGIKDVQRAT